MSTRLDDGTVRQFARQSCAVAAEVRSESDAVILSHSVASPDGWVDAVIEDVSLGGVGLRCDVYFPRRAKLYVRLKAPTTNAKSVMSATGASTSAASSAGKDAAQAAILQRGVVLGVRRCAMVDRRPTYVLGTAFVDADPEHARAFVEAFADGGFATTGETPQRGASGDESADAGEGDGA
jgi:hypothetical protein